jgi:hypothetical protein
MADPRFSMFLDFSPDLFLSDCRLDRSSGFDLAVGAECHFAAAFCAVPVLVFKSGNRSLIYTLRAKLELDC